MRSVLPCLLPRPNAGLQTTESCISNQLSLFILASHWKTLQQYLGVNSTGALVTNRAGHVWWFTVSPEPFDGITAVALCHRQLLASVSLHMERAGSSGNVSWAALAPSARVLVLLCLGRAKPMNGWLEERVSAEAHFPGSTPIIQLKGGTACQELLDLPFRSQWLVHIAPALPLILAVSDFLRHTHPRSWIN